ncbi:MAG: hypothetical protein AAB834_05920 [Patescibacteria group bacterium]
MITKNSELPKKKGSRLSKYTWPVVAVLLLVILGLGILEWRGTIHLFEEDRATSGTIPSQSHPDSSASSKDEKPTTPKPATPQSPKQDPPPATPSGEAPIAPNGNFISNHHPNLDGSPNPSSINSTCITTPGATCRIEFVNSDGVVKGLKDQVTNGNGETSWIWDIKQAGFTSGSWKIKAIATLNGQTASAEDVQSFEIGP